MKYDLNEITRYMGGKIESIDSNFRKEIELCWDKFILSVSPKHEYLTLDINIHNNTVILTDLNIVIKSKNLSRHLEECDKVIILLSTLGVAASNIIRKHSIISSTKELIYNSIANYYLEEYNDIIHNNFNNTYGCTTNRFGTGYGDFDLLYQEKLLRLFPNKIGISINSNYIFNPKKTTLSLIGIGKTHYDQMNGCKICNLNNSCIHRKEN